MRGKYKEPRNLATQSTHGCYLSAFLVNYLFYSVLIGRWRKYCFATAIVSCRWCRQAEVARHMQIQCVFWYIYIWCIMSLRYYRYILELTLLLRYKYIQIIYLPYHGDIRILVYLTLPYILWHIHNLVSMFLCICVFVWGRTAGSSQSLRCSNRQHSVQQPSHYSEMTLDRGNVAC